MSNRLEGKMLLSGNIKEIKKVKKIVSEERVRRHNDELNYPGIWLQWKIIEDNNQFFLEWDGGEKFYNSVEWLSWIIDNIFKINNITINGKIYLFENHSENTGVIYVKNNNVRFISLKDFSETLD